MIILYGRYRFWRKITGCRKDFCNVCNGEILSEQWQAFYFSTCFLSRLYLWDCINIGNVPPAIMTRGCGVNQDAA